MYSRAQEDRLPSSSQPLSVQLSMEVISTSLSDRVAQALQFELDRIRTQKQADSNIKWFHRWHIQTHFLRLIFNNYDASVCKMPEGVNHQNMIKHLRAPTIIFIGILSAWRLNAVSKKLSDLHSKPQDELITFSQNREQNSLRRTIRKAFKKERLRYAIDVMMSIMADYCNLHVAGIASSIINEKKFQENILYNLLLQTEQSNLIARFPILLGYDSFFYSEILPKITPILQRNRGAGTNIFFNEREIHFAKISELMISLNTNKAHTLRSKMDDLNQCTYKDDIGAEIKKVKDEIALLSPTLLDSKFFSGILEKIETHLEFLTRPVILNNKAEETYKTVNTEYASQKKAALFHAYNLNAFLVMKLAYLAMGAQAIDLLEQGNSLRQIIDLCKAENYQKKLTGLPLALLDESYFADSQSVERLCYQIYLEKTADAPWKIRNKINMFELNVVLMRSYGHCLYAAIGQYTGQNEQTIRARVADVLLRDINIYHAIVSELLLPDQTIDDFLNGIRTGEWTGQLNMTILMQVLQTTIIVIHPDGRMEHGDTLSQYTQNEPIFVYYNGVNHYDGLERNASFTTGREVFDRLLREHERNLEPFQFINNQLISRDGYTRQCFDILRKHDVPRCYQYFFMVVIIAVHITSGIKNPRDRVNILDAILSKTTDTPLSNKILKSKMKESRLNNPPWLAMYLPNSDIKAYFPAAHATALRHDSLLWTAINIIPPVVREVVQGSFDVSPLQETRPQRRWW
jgi:hypothetical protein